MQYLGGKSKIAKWIASAISPYLRGNTFWEPFCGGLSVSVALSEISPGIVSDGHKSLISLYEAVSNGWSPPDDLSEIDYQNAKLLPDSDPLKAFAGFGNSFGGKWFGGFARSGDHRHHGNESKRALLRDIPLLLTRGCSLYHVDFMEVKPAPTTEIIYADPPYAGTTGYSTGAFDHDKFWQRIAEWSRYTTVFVSEYSCPFATPAILEFTHNLQISGGSEIAARTEKLFKFSP